MPGESMREKNGEHPFGDAGQLILLGIFLIVWVGDSFFLRQSTFLSQYLPLHIRLLISGTAIVIAFYLFGSGHVVVHQERRSAGLVTSGAFRYVRHPLYLASILTYFGLMVLTTSIFSLVLLAGIFIFYNFIARYEERLLQEKYRGEYDDYMERTGRWVPRIRRRR
jgi:protein-S-isoprenylcysteine O-methyltransferase Ste14